MRRGRARALLLVVVLAALAPLLWREAPPGPTGAWLAAVGLQPQFQTAEGVRVRYVRAGSGPSVILLHGLASSIFTWRDVIPALAKRHDMVALDLPGFGGFDQPPDLSPELYPRLVPALMDRLGIAKASFIGHSMGGAVSVLVAVKHPDQVDRMVLIDSAGFNLAPRDRPWLLRVGGSAAAGVVMDRLPIRRLIVRTGLRQVFYDDSLVTPERVEEYLAPLARPGAAASIRSLMTSMRGGDSMGFPDVIARVRAPTLILWGSEDTWAPAWQADRFAAAIPGSRKTILPACGHMPQEERPAEVVRLIEGFLDR